ncbi:MAG: hypothetical protein ACTSUT_12600 [Promethearchaeota archaeon]
MVIWNIKEINKELNPEPKIEIWEGGIKLQPNVHYLKLEQEMNDINLKIVSPIYGFYYIAVLQADGKLQLNRYIGKDTNLSLDSNGQIILSNYSITCELSKGSEKNKKGFKFRVWTKGVANRKKVIYFKLEKFKQYKDNFLIRLCAVSYLGEPILNNYIFDILPDGKMRLWSAINNDIGLNLRDDGKLVLNNLKVSYDENIL